MRAGNTQLAASSEPSAASAQLCGCRSVTWPLVTWHLLGLPRHTVPGLLIPHSQDLWLLTGQELFFPRNKQRVGMTLAISGPSCSSLWFFFLNYPIEFHMSAILGKWLVELTDPECFNGWKVSICVCLWGSALSLYSRWICNCGVWHPTLPVGDSALFFPAFSLELPAVSIQLRRFPNLPLFRSFAPVNPKIIQLQGVHQLSPILLFTCGDPVKSGGDLVGCFSNSLSMWPPGL